MPLWFAEYKCGCVSEFVNKKSDLLEYCGIHGDDIRNKWPSELGGEERDEGESDNTAGV